jgi:hypothetical protein
MNRSSAPIACCVVLGVVTSCSPPDETVCGLSTTPPSVDEVANGHGRAVRSDRVPFDEEGSWSLGPNGSVDISVLAMIKVFDENGGVVDDLIADGAFPICVRQGERSETSGQANFVDGGFATDADHEGALAILGKDEELLVGRFSVTLVNQAGVTLSFDDGVFRVPRR